MRLGGTQTSRKANLNSHYSHLLPDRVAARLTADLSPSPGASNLAMRWLGCDRPFSSGPSLSNSLRCPTQGAMVCDFLKKEASTPLHAFSVGNLDEVPVHS